MAQEVTASILYDYLQCPHKVWRDAHGPQEEKIKETNPFVQLLWERGIAHEAQVVQQLGQFLDLSKGSRDERATETLRAMEQGVPLIYQGILQHHNLLGIPDLLRKEEDGGYVPIDVKSGSAFEGRDSLTEDEGKPKKHYAVQLCLYCEVLAHLGFTDRRKGIIIDVQGSEVVYDLSSPMGKRSKSTWWDFYEDSKKETISILENVTSNKPAIASVCKLCPWCYSCDSWCKENDDLSQIFKLGRRKRDTLNRDIGIEKLQEFTKLDIEKTLDLKKIDKTLLKGIAEKTITAAVRRAAILVNKTPPLLYTTLDLPNASEELYFDIENDPTQDFVYLHGIVERTQRGEGYRPFVARALTPEAEKQAWRDAWSYLHDKHSSGSVIYYYAPHERTTYKKLQQLYPDVVSENLIAKFFESPRVVDLYQIIDKHTDWPLSSYSLKAIAVYLGFKWRDESPSGAMSILWFNEFIESQDQRIMNRILEYNEDDCRSMIAVKDKLEELNSTL